MSNTITIFNTLNTNKLKTLIDSDFTVSWGDGSSDTIVSMPTVYNEYLPYASHTYATSGTYDIEITIDSPWKVEKLKRPIDIPITDVTYPNPLGTLWFHVPYSNPTLLRNQQYLENYNDLIGNVDPLTGVTISFMAVGKSRIDEFKKYGSSNVYSGIEYLSKVIEGVLVNYTGYTIDNLFYMDFPEGYTYITGNTITPPDFFSMEEYSGYTGMITRNEHLIGFLDEPQIYSDIFVDRGKQGVMERNFRLGEIDSIGELDIYGSGFFKVKKQ